MAKKEYPAPNAVQRALIRRHGYDPRFFVIKRELNYSLFIMDIRDNSVKIIDKH